MKLTGAKKKTETKQRWKGRAIKNQTEKGGKAIKNWNRKKVKRENKKNKN
jgi:hypothetical protein